MKRLLVTGTRFGWPMELVSAGLYAAYRVLEPEPSIENVLLVHGDARGIDTQAKKIWESLNMPDEPHPANWALYRGGAGPRRNSEMVRLGADLCVAFPDLKSIGTWDCVRKARAANIPVLIMGEYKEPE